uniref:Putative secreted protein n=1 Tax=Ixodes ricinus TaxID=34613 RepID=A0A6B0U4R6_IXORI
MRTLAMALVLASSSRESCGFPPRKGGMFRVAPTASTSSEMTNPLSAMTESPGSRRAHSPEFAVRALSDTRPGARSLTKDTNPLGVMPSKPFAVLWHL